MDNRNKFIFFLLILAGIIILILFSGCRIEFKDGLKSADVVAKLVSFGIVAILIERFVDNVIIPGSYRNMINNIRMKSVRGKAGFAEALTDPETDEHDTQFSWLAFGISFLIAALGFRFFATICNSTCAGVFHEQYIFPGTDIFLTAILLSGGSQFVARIIKWINDNSK